ncbi:MAG: bifunctional (p)ppGpp synthetase/guanosine-3',5'-bis(diphosphate) 3'-pyrophosphohydrolase [Betaproteobacteria bacterium]|nr:bifunctional (p)ppGpp synthetase/guanosine-3',5'-bis(diphosphate) 3'-pyrophosphohydrolase [Betaproteobacteria bacterium]
MVTVTHSLAPTDIGGASIELLYKGLGDDERRRLESALEVVGPLYEGRVLGTGEDMLRHAVGMALIVASLKLDVETRLAGLLFAVLDCIDHGREMLEQRFGANVAQLVLGLHRLNGLRLITRAHVSSSGSPSAPDVRAQAEILRKMLLSMVEDVRVVVLRLASRTQTLRYLADKPTEQRLAVARESMDIYAPLANRLGIWPAKWELEDLSFRYLEPETYKRIARMLDERRVERESFIAEAVGRLKSELAATGIDADVYGRPKHIYSIYNKMRDKHLEFGEVYDVRAVRVLVDEVKDCYTALGIAHNLWQPIPKEFDDYISVPKGNYYRSLHTAVRMPDGRALEVQIRTREMHRHAELGVAAHWRYKEGAGQDRSYDDKIAWLRQLLSWRDEITDGAGWMEQFKRAALDDTVYVITPQDKVIDLPHGATPVDFAYRVHTEMGHRCRGARVDGVLVPLNTALSNGQRVEIITAKQGGPSRDWLNPQQGYLASSRSRNKVRQWFANQETAETLARGRAFVMRELQREGHAQANIETLAKRLGLAGSDALYLAAGRDELGPRQIQIALRTTPQPMADAEAQVQTRPSKADGSGGDILVVGVGNLLTQLARCCKPVPPDKISGFVTRGRGVSLHRADCPNFAQMLARHPERVVTVAWGGGAASGEAQAGRYVVDIHLEAMDRQGLLRDISDVLSREKINVTAVNTQTRADVARMGFTIEVTGAAQVDRALAQIREVASVTSARRA